MAFSRYIREHNRKDEGAGRPSGPADIWEDIDGDLGEEADLDLGVDGDVDESLTSISKGRDDVTESEANATGGSLSG